MHFWAAQVVDSRSAILRARRKTKSAPKHEIDRIEWFSAAKALRLLTHERDVQMLQKLVQYYEQRQLDTRTLIVVRHAKAIKRSSWKGGKGAEHTRPLSASGKLRAQELVGELSAYGISSLRTSPWRRCVSTFQPYAEITGVNLRRKNGMTERSYANDTKWVSKYFMQMVADLQKNRAVCVHRPTLPGFLVQIKEFSTAEQFAKIRRNDPWLEPGEMLVLHLTKRADVKRRIVQIERVSSDLTS
ncbi:histidine phosphatase family protein [Arcanobacterium hippocoleae]